MSKRTDNAVDFLLDQIERETEPRKMSAADALEVMERIRDELELRMEALRDDIERE